MLQEISRVFFFKDIYHKEDISLSTKGKTHLSEMPLLGSALTCDSHSPDNDDARATNSHKGPSL